MFNEYKPSKTLQRVADRDARISEYICDQDGHWWILAHGYHEADYGAHALRADTTRALLDKRHLIEPEGV